MGGRLNILGMLIDPLTEDTALLRIRKWAEDRKSKMVCAANVHMVVETWDRPEFRKVVNGADMILPDGSGLAMGISVLNWKRIRRFRGPDLMLKVCEMASTGKIGIGLYGGRVEYQDKLIAYLKSRLPGLDVRLSIIPPFREITQEENDQYVRMINESGAAILFVGIGCPKQENWISGNKHRIHAVMIGVGGAFDQYSGRVSVTPRWIQKGGIEWLYRLIHEPRRLWRRNFFHSTRYLFLVMIQGLGFFLLRKKNIPL